MNVTAPNVLLVVIVVFALLRVPGGATARSLERNPREPVAAAESPEEAHEGRRELTFKIINFVLLAGVLGFALRKPVSEFLNQRSASIRKSLEEGRKVLETSRAQLDLVEEKLGRLEEEIKAFQAAAAQEILAERERLRKETAEEAQKILSSARAQMETATRAAQLELKAHAVAQAAKLAEEMIRERLDDAGRRRLVSRFVEGLEAKRSRRVDA